MIRKCVLVSVALACLLAATAARAADPPALAPGCKEWKDTRFLHPPLAAMEPYKRFDEYPVSAWCFHGINAARSPYADKYVKDAKAIGFNVLIDDERILPFAERVGGVKVQLAKLWLPHQGLAKQLFDNPKVGDHPLVQAIIIGDNGRGLGQRQLQTSDWLTANYPHVPAIMSVYPHRSPGNTSLRIWHMQNYPYLRGGRGTGAANAYLTQCNYDRRFVNTNRMALFECFGGDAPFTCVRFQMVAAMAYGAQGLSNFCYSPHRMAAYRPDSDMVPHWSKMHRYIIHVLGWHVWGMRSIDVLHSVHGGAHKGAKGFDDKSLVVRAAEYMMVGLLTPEAKFYSKDEADRAIPEYFMVVDKRTGGNTPPAADTYVMLATRVPVVELIDHNATLDAPVRQLVPGSKIRLKTEGSDSVLLRVSPDMEKLLGGPEGLALYAKINTALASLQWQITPPKPAGQKPTPEADLPRTVLADKAIAASVKATKADVAELAKILAAAVKDGTISKAQAADTVGRLNAAIDATAAEARTAPKKTR